MLDIALFAGGSAQFIQRALDGGISRTTSIIPCPPPSLLFNPLFKMTIVSDDPSLWPTINFVTMQSYVIGSWRANGPTQSLTVFAQLQPLLWLYMIGVRKIMLIRIKKNTDVTCRFLSTDIRTRSRLRWIMKRSTHLTENGPTVRIDMGGQSRTRNELPANLLNLMQRQRWSLMTVIYLTVRSICLYKSSWDVLTSRYARCATLQYHSPCMFARLRTWKKLCANKGSLSISVTLLSMSLRLQCGCFFWQQDEAGLPFTPMTDAVSISVY